MANTQVFVSFSVARPMLAPRSFGISSYWNVRKSAMESGIFALFKLLAMGYSHCLYSSLRTARENPKLTAWSRSLLAAVRRFIFKYSSARAT